MILPAAVAASDAANNRALDQFPPHLYHTVAFR